MANGDEAESNSNNNNQPVAAETDVGAEARGPLKPPLQLDLGDEIVHSPLNALNGTTSNNNEPEEIRGRPSTPGLPTNEAPSIFGAVKRDNLDNPISFTHFLRDNNNMYNNNGDQYQHMGARPKVYKTAAGGQQQHHPIGLSISDLEMTPPRRPTTKQNHLPPTVVDYPAATLPDFVQDHLIVEQCYNLGSTQHNNNNGSSSSSTFSFDLNNVPDFAHPSSTDSVKINRFNYNDDDNDESEAVRMASAHVPPLRHYAPDFPLDLPITNGGNSIPKALPDFLPDGAEVEAPDKKCERLQHELGLVRRHLCEQIRQNQIVSCELQEQQELNTNRNHQSVVEDSLKLALQSVQAELKRANESRTAAEVLADRLQEQMRRLRIELRHLKEENAALRSNEGAVGGIQLSSHHSTNSYQSDNAEEALWRRQISQDLRAAATSAEHSLRQLLNGVVNLRVMATNVEKTHKTDTFIDSDEDCGPSL